MISFTKIMSAVVVGFAKADLANMEKQFAEKLRNLTNSETESISRCSYTNGNADRLLSDDR